MKNDKDRLRFILGSDPRIANELDNLSTRWVGVWARAMERKLDELGEVKFKEKALSLTRGFVAQMEQHGFGVL